MATTFAALLGTGPLLFGSHGEAALWLSVVALALVWVSRKLRREQPPEPPEPARRPA